MLVVSRDIADARLLILLPNFLAPYPSTEHIATTIEEDEVCISAGAERALPILDAKAPRGVESRTFDRLTQRTSREAREVADTSVQSDNAEASESRHGSHRQ